MSDISGIINKNGTNFNYDDNGTGDFRIVSGSTTLVESVVIQYLLKERERMIDQINKLSKALDVKPMKKKKGFFKKIFNKK